MRVVVGLVAALVFAGTPGGPVPAHTAAVASPSPLPVTPAPSPSAAPTPQPAASTPSGADAPVAVTLPNGMRVVIVPDRLAPVALTAIAYGVGSRDDTTPGIAHATEHMLFRGTRALSGSQLAAVAARMGAAYDAFTNETNTIFYYKIPAAYVPIAIAIEADRMRNATIADADWATERGAIEQEVRAHEAGPIAAPAQKTRDAFLAGTPYAHAPVGTVPAFEALTGAQIRAFYQRWYVPSNATLVISGDVDVAAVLTRVRAAFGAVDGPPTPPHDPFVLPVLAAGTVSADVDFPLGLALIGYRFPGRNAPDYAASQVLALIMQSGRGSLAALATSGRVLGSFPVENAFREFGTFGVLVVPAHGDSAQHALALVQDAVDGYRTSGVPSDLVDAAKARILVGDASRGASISGLGLAWLDAIDVGTTPAAEADAVAAVTKADVDAAAQRYLVSTHSVAMVLNPKPTKAVASTPPAQEAEHVGVAAPDEAPLPAWARAALSVPLRSSAIRGDAPVFGQLPNGLRYAIRRETSAPMVIVEGVVRTAPMLYEPRGKDGVQQIVDSLLGWGTQTMPYQEYQRQFDLLAADARLGSTFLLAARSEDLERGLALVADGMLHPAFDQVAFAVAKQDVAQSVAASEGLPQTQAAAVERAAMYEPKDPRLRVATSVTIASLTLADVNAYYHSAYRPDVTTIAVVGDVDPQRAVAALRAAFGPWRASGPRPTFAFPRLPVAKAGRSVTVASRTATQADVTLRETIPLRFDDPDYVPLELANTILSGEGTGSLLMRELRTRRGYVYSVGSSLSVDQTGSTFTLSYASDPKNARAANAAALAVLQNLRDHPLPVETLQRAKALLLAQRILPLDSFGGVALDMLAGASGGVDGGAQWFWNALVRVTPAQLQHAMRRIDPQRFVRLTIQPAG
jgi:zinc protease